MSYAASAGLQAAIYQHLQADTGVSALAAGAIYDALPTGTLPDLYVSLGEEDVRDRSEGTGSGALHLLSVSVVDNGAGFARTKAVAAAISDALDGADLALARGDLMYLRFDRATARRTQNGGLRRVNLIFRAQISDI